MTGGIKGSGATPAFTGIQGMLTEPGAPAAEANPTTPLDLSLPFTNDGFEVGAPTAGSADTGSPEMRRALDRYHGRLESILGHDAMSLAQGRTPITSSDQMTDAQKDRLVGASKDLLMEMPISDLAPSLVAGIQDAAAARGLDLGDLRGKSLKDLGELGGDLAKGFADNLREESPAVFYGIAGAAAVAVGAHGYLNGSEAIRDLGIKPEFKTGLLNDRLSVGVSADWGPKFSDPEARADLQAHVLRGRMGHLTLDSSIDTEGDASFGLRGSIRGEDWSASGSATIDTDGQFSAGASARWTPNDNVEGALTGRVNRDGDAFIGLGLKIKW